MNLLRLLILLAFLLAGLVIGSLNSEQVTLNFGLAEVPTTSGIAIIVSLLAGVLLGGAIVLATLVIPLYAKLRRANRRAATPAEPVPQPPFDGR